MLFISFSRLLCAYYVGFRVYTIMSSTHREFYIILSISMPFYSCLIALLVLPAQWIAGLKAGILVLYLLLGFSLKPLKILLPMIFLYTPFITLRKFPSISSLISVLMIKRWWFFSNTFSAFIKIIMSLLFYFILLMWYSTLIHFLTFNRSYILKINPHS